MGYNDLLGLATKNKESYFRSVNTASITSNLVYGFGPVGGANWELKGTALSLITDTSADGTKIVCNEEGLYVATVSMRINTGSSTCMIGKANAGVTPTNPASTLNEVAFVDITGTGARFTATGTVYMLPGQYFYVWMGSSPATGGSSLHIAKVSGAL